MRRDAFRRVAGMLEDGTAWTTDLSAIAPLAAATGDAGFRTRWRSVRRGNKARLSDIVLRDCGVRFDPDALFDVQVKRIHEYKRQLLNALHVVHLYDRIKRGDGAGLVPRCVLFGGKAAPGYHMAKQIIRFVCAVAEVVNRDACANPQAFRFPKAPLPTNPVSRQLPGDRKFIDGLRMQF